MLAPDVFVTVTRSAPPPHAGLAIPPTVTAVTFPRDVV